MKRAFVLVAVVIGLVYLLAPIPAPHQNGAYNTFTRLAYCRTRSACLHEIAHALDQHAGWISQEPEFVEAVKAYLYYGLHYDVQPLAAGIVELTYRNVTPRIRNAEIYAYVFVEMDGDIDSIPDDLRCFYNVEQAERLMSKLDNSRIYVLR